MEMDHRHCTLCSSHTYLTQWLPLAQVTGWQRLPFHLTLSSLDSLLGVQSWDQCASASFPRFTCFRAPFQSLGPILRAGRETSQDSDGARTGTKLENVRNYHACSCIMISSSWMYVGDNSSSTELQTRPPRAIGWPGLSLQYG